MNNTKSVDAATYSAFITDLFGRLLIKGYGEDDALEIAVLEADKLFLGLDWGAK